MRSSREKRKEKGTDYFPSNFIPRKFSLKPNNDIIVPLFITVKIGSLETRHNTLCRVQPFEILEIKGALKKTCKDVHSVL